MFALLLALLVPILFLYVRFLWKIVTSPDFFVVMVYVGVAGHWFGTYLEASRNGRMVWAVLFALLGAAGYFAILVLVHKHLVLLSFIINFASIFGAGFYLFVMETGLGKLVLAELPVLSSNANTNLVIYSLVAVFFYVGFWGLRMKGLQDWVEGNNGALSGKEYYVRG